MPGRIAASISHSARRLRTIVPATHVMFIIIGGLLLLG